MSRRLFIHPGFHKTGTTTLQSTLRNNRDLLDPHVELIIAGDIVQMLLIGAIKEFSLERRGRKKDLIREEALFLFEDLDPKDPRPVVMSNECLCGYEIGVKKVTRFAAAAPALEMVFEAWREVMGPDAPFEVYFSTRRDGWLDSCYWQRLKSDRYRLPKAEFMTRFAVAADHQAIIDEVRARLPQAQISSLDIADTQHPVLPVLAQLGLTHLFDELVLPENQNRRASDEIVARLSALNRSELRGKDFWDKKREILKGTDAEIAED